MDNSCFYNYDKIISYNAMLNFLVGERGVGKTFGAKQFVVNDFLKRNHEFAYFRRYDNELKKAIPNFFDDLKNANKFSEHDLKSKSRKFYCDDKIFGYAMRLTEAQDLKSATFINVHTIIFDEFIIEKSRRTYLPNEVNTFLGAIESIARTRNVRVFLLGNAVSNINPYYLYFDLKNPFNSDIQTFKNGLILVQHMQNKAYQEEKSKTKFGQLVSGTEYADYAIANNFISDSDTNFIEKKQGTSKFTFAFIYKRSNVRRLD